MTHRSDSVSKFIRTSFFLRQKAFDRRQLSESIERRGQSPRKSVHFHCQVWSQIIAISQIWRLQSDQDIGVILSHQPTNSGPWKAKYRNQLQVAASSLDYF